jgi:hypothetical protein
MMTVIVIGVISAYVLVVGYDIMLCYGFKVGFNGF